MIKWAGHTDFTGKRKYIHTKSWIEKAEGKSLVRRPRRKWQNEIKRNGKVVGEKVLFGFMWFRIVTSDRFL